MYFKIHIYFYLIKLLNNGLFLKLINFKIYHCQNITITIINILATLGVVSDNHLGQISR